jgi:hypothetical protein
MNASHPSVGSPVGSALGFWKFDEGYGNVAHNSGSGGSNYNAVLAASTATPTWTQDGKFGKALTFDGINDYASAPMGSGTITNQVSISMWIKFNNLSSQQNFFSLYDSSVNRYVPYKSPGNQLLCWDNNETLNSNVTVVVGRWYHYVCTSDGSKLSIYVDGQLKNSTSTSFALANNAQTTYFGSDAGGVNLNGSLDEVKIYNYALTADEIKLDYNHGSSKVLGSMSDTSGLAGGSVASNSASAAYCTPGDTSTCSSPVGEWNFEEGNGNSVNDSSGNGLIGTMTNGATWTSGKLGKAGNFNGASVRQGVQVSNNALLNPGTGSFTTEAWIKTTQTGNAKRITTKRGSSSTWFSMYIYNGLLAFETAVSYPSYYTVGTGNKIINNGQWHHVVMVRDTSQSKILLYVDGALDVSPTDNTAGQSITNSEIFEIGIWGTEAYDTGSYTGKIDQVRMFNYARTPAQIAYDYNRGAPVGYWKFDECQGTTLNDSSGNGNNGTIIIGATGSQTTAGTCLTPTDGTGAWYNGASGKFNASLKFDGNDDYATLTSTPTTGTGSFSIFGWVKTSSTGTRKQILAYGSDSSNNGEWVFINTSNQVESDLSTVAGPNSAVTVTDGNWHFVGVVNNTNTFQIYVDGKASGNSSSMSPNIGTGNTPVIGSGMGGNAGGWRFNGQIDDLRVYNYALTASQIKQVMNQGAGVRFGPLTGTP